MPAWMELKTSRCTLQMEESLRRAGNRPKPEHASRRSLLLRGLILLLAGIGPGSACMEAQASCTPPDSMRERLVAKPDAAALNDLGVWFADQKDYACSARVFATSLQTDP